MMSVSQNLFEIRSLHSVCGRTQGEAGHALTLSTIHTIQVSLRINFELLVNASISSKVKSKSCACKHSLNDDS